MLSKRKLAMTEKALHRGPRSPLRCIALFSGFLRLGQNFLKRFFARFAGVQEGPQCLSCRSSLTHPFFGLPGFIAQHAGFDPTLLRFSVAVEFLGYAGHGVEVEHGFVFRVGFCGCHAIDVLQPPCQFRITVFS